MEQYERIRPTIYRRLLEGCFRWSASMLAQLTKNKRSSGFTLIEIMIALVIFSFLILVFAATVPVATRTTSLNAQYAKATSLCQHKLDQMRAISYGRIINTGTSQPNYAELLNAGIIDTTPNTAPFHFTNADEVDDILPQATTSIAIQDDTPMTNTCTVTVTITWKAVGRGTNTSSVSISTLIANLG